MTVNWSWPKATALTTVQTAASTLLGLIIGHSFLEIDWTHSLEAAALAGGVTFLRAVAAYAAPSGTATALLSATVSAAQDARATAPSDEPSLYDARGARGF